jgi:hypothetical protein
MHKGDNLVTKPHQGWGFVQPTLPFALIFSPLLSDALLLWPQCVLHCLATFLPARLSNRHV